MNHYDDYQDEMRDLKDLREAEIDRILAGQSMVGEPMSELAAFLKTVPSAFHELPDEPTERAHLDAIVAAAHELKGERVLPPAPSPVRPTWRRVVVRMKSFTLKLAASAGAAFLGLTGLAYAGVDLPGSTVEEAIESVLKVDLPNQEVSNGKSSSDDVEAAKEPFGDERGCEFGQAVATAASGKADDPEKQDPCVKGDEGKSDDADSDKAKKPKKPKKAKDKTGKSDTAPNGNANANGQDPDKVRGKSDAEHGNANGQDPDKVRGKSDVEHGTDDTETDDDAKEKGKSETAPHGNGKDDDTE